MVAVPVEGYTFTINLLTGKAMSTLYERLGEESGLTSTVEIFYSALLADPLLAHFFDGIDMERQRSHQMLFLKYALGGGEPPPTGLRAAHRRLVEEMGLNQVHFNAVLGHLEATLLQLQVERGDVDTVLARLEPLRDEVLGL